MGRIAQDFKIPTNIFCGMANKLDQAMYERMKRLARSKGMSTHQLIEIILERYLKEQK